MNLLMGIGNILRRDDGAGVYIADRFSHEGWHVLNCGTVPENFTGIVRRVHPDLLILVDAADMQIEPGERRIIPPERIADVGIGTHQIPLIHLIRYLEGDAGQILFIGIQPQDLGDGEGLTDPVKNGAEKLIEDIKTGNINNIQKL